MQSVSITTKVVSFNTSQSGKVYWIQHYVIKFVSIILTSCFLHVYVYLEQSQLEYKKIVEGLNCDNKKMPCQNKNKSSCRSNLSHLWIFEILGLLKEILNSDVQAFHQYQQKETTTSHHKPLNKNKQRNHGIWHRRSRSWYILFENIISIYVLVFYLYSVVNVLR